MEAAGVGSYAGLQIAAALQVAKVAGDRARRPVEDGSQRALGRGGLRPLPGPRPNDLQQRLGLRRQPIVSRSCRRHRVGILPAVVRRGTIFTRSRHRWPRLARRTMHKRGGSALIVDEHSDLCRSPLRLGKRYPALAKLAPDLGLRLEARMRDQGALPCLGAINAVADRRTCPIGRLGWLRAVE